MTRRMYGWMEGDRGRAQLEGPLSQLRRTRAHSTVRPRVLFFSIIVIAHHHLFSLLSTLFSSFVKIYGYKILIYHT